MQLHDKYLESKIIAIEKATAHTPLNTRFKLIQGIVYICSPNSNQHVLCVSRPVAKPIAFHLHNNTTFHLLARLLFCKDLFSITKSMVKS